METESTVQDDDFYIFSKDRRNHSGECSSSENVTTYQYVNGDEARKFERNVLAQQSMPNLKTNGRFASYGSLLVNKKYSESDPLLGRNDRQYEHTVRPPFISRYHRTQIFLFFYIVFFVGYLIVGSICFQRLERDTEMDIRREFREAREVFLLEHPNVKGNGSTRERINELHILFGNYSLPTRKMKGNLALTANILLKKL